MVGLLKHFSASAGSGQSVSLTLTDETVMAITYDETSQKITVEGKTYASGDSFIVEGKRITVYDV